MSMVYPQDCFLIIFTNKCYDDISVAIHYKDMDDAWLTRGWFKVSSYKEKVVVPTKNTIFYFYVKSKNGKYKWSGDDLYRTVQGSETKYGFRKSRIKRSDWGTWKESLTCE